MAMNRRNVLVGLGAVAVGGGAAFGSGAFSQVSAARTVSVSTEGDASGFLGLSGDAAYITNDNSSSALTIDLGQATSGNGFNNEARTVVEDIVTATNDAADGENVDVGFDDGTGTQVASDDFVLGDGNGNPVADVTLYFGTENSQSVATGVTSGGTATMGVIVDTRSSTLNGAAPAGASTDVTVLAVDSDGS